jgi:hypothetical protein
MRLLMVAVVVLVTSTAAADAKALLSISVSPAQSLAPANLTIRVQVEPDVANRSLEVVAESGDYYRSSRIQLDGSAAPRTISVQFRDVPGGDYDVRGTLLSGAGKVRAAARQRVLVVETALAGETS